MTLFLIDAVLKATFLLAAAGVITTMLRRSSAASRHLVWTTALLAALALPVLSLALPRWQVPVIQVAATPPPADMTESQDSASRQMAARLFAQLSNGAATTTPLAHEDAGSASSVPWAAVAAALWLVGVTCVLGRLLIGFVAVHVLARRAPRTTDARWLPLARDLADALGVSRVTFRRSRHASMPMAWGLWRASVTLPADADGWPEERLRIVLLHELAHVKRRDCLTHVLSQVACALYWFNPLAWVAARHVRAERERACDDLVLAAGTPGADYADQLLEIARVLRAGRLSSVVAGASLAMAHRSQLEGRLVAILDPSVARTGISRSRGAAAVAVAVMTLLPLASLQAWSHGSQSVPAPPMAPAPVPAPAPDPSGAAAPPPAPAPAPPPAPVPPPPAGVRGSAQAVVDGVRAAVEDFDRSDDQDVKASGGKTDPKVIAALTAALKDSDKEVRETALHALVRLRDPGVFEPLVAALKDGSADVREQAAFGLGRMRDKRAVDPLLAATKDADAGVREQAIFALGQLRDARATEALVSGLKDSHANVREQAAFALGQIRAAGAIEALVVALKDSSASVREQAAFALGQIRDPRAIDGLTAALKDASASVRQQAAYALGQLAR